VFITERTQKQISISFTQEIQNDLLCKRGRFNLNINFFLVSYDRLYDKSIEQLDANELSMICGYWVQKKVPKDISKIISRNINEWDLSWNDYEYQSKQYYEYGAMVHLLNNPKLLENLSHVGILHYDVVFQKNSINNMISILNKNPNTIFYQRKRNGDLYLSRQELDNICKFMSEKLNMSINSDFILQYGWISEALSLTPKSVFLKFASFIEDNRQEIEEILLKNKWGIMRTNHRVCGIIERMWGFYLVSCGLPLIHMEVTHDRDSYVHKHESENNWIKS